MARSLARRAQRTESNPFEVNELVEALKYKKWRTCIVQNIDTDGSCTLRILGHSSVGRAVFPGREDRMRKIQTISQGPWSIGTKHKALVIAVTYSGALVHLGGANVGFAQRTCMRSGWCVDPFEEIQEGQYVDVWVKAVEGDRVSLTMSKEKLQPIIVPANGPSDYEGIGVKVGDTFRGMVCELKKSYCWVAGFVQKDDGLVQIRAMLRLSHMANPDLIELVQKDGEVQTSTNDVADVVYVGQELDLTVVRIEPSLLHVTAMPLEDALRREEARQQRRRAQAGVGVS